MNAQRRVSVAGRIMSLYQIEFLPSHAYAPLLCAKLGPVQCAQPGSMCKTRLLYDLSILQVGFMTDIRKCFFRHILNNEMGQY